MNKFVGKFKVKDAFQGTEDSSDYMSSDLENSISASVSSTAVHSLPFAQSKDPKTLMLNAENSIMLEDSNDSFLTDRDVTVHNNTMTANPSTPSTHHHFGHHLQHDHNQMSSMRARTKSQTQPSTPVANSKSAPIDEGRLAECLDYIHRMICRKDKEDIFQYPVTDDIAPGYSLIIEHPMDLSTMRKKIDTHAYKSLVEYRDDLILMCENCMTYNKPDTIYYQAAKKMLDYGLKMMSKDKLISLRNTVRIMRYLTPNEIGFSLDHDSSNETEPSPQLIRQRAQKSQQKTFSSAIASGLLKNVASLTNKTKILHNMDVIYTKESYLLPPEGDDVECDENMADEVKELANAAAKRLAVKNKNGKMGFMRRNSNGTLGYNFLKNSQLTDAQSEANEKSVTIGNLSEGLQANLYTMASFAEDKKDKSKPIYYVENGPFSSHAPVYDTSYSGLSKEETDLLTSIYGDEAGYQYALSFMEFSKDTGVMFNRYMSLVLNTITQNEHEKYVKYLRDKKSTTSSDVVSVKTEEEQSHSVENQTVK